MYYSAVYLGYSVTVTVWVGPTPVRAGATAVGQCVVGHLHGDWLRVRATGIQWHYSYRTAGVCCKPTFTLLQLHFTSLALTPQRCSQLDMLCSGWPLITSWVGKTINISSSRQTIHSRLLYDSIEKAQTKKLNTIAYLFALLIKFGTKSWGPWHY